MDPLDHRFTLFDPYDPPRAVCYAGLLLRRTGASLIPSVAVSPCGRTNEALDPAAPGSSVRLGTTLAGDAGTGTCHPLQSESSRVGAPLFALWHGPNAAIAE